MALSFTSVQDAYKVFNELKRTVIPELEINSWPEDLAELSKREREKPRLCEVYGFSKKSDDGWENIVFFVKDPSTDLKQKFDELKSNVGNSSMARPYKDGSDIWIFGWF